MPKFEVDSLTEMLKEQYGDDLRWVANHDSNTYKYRFHHVRKDLREELKGNQLDRIIHRALAVYNKRHTEEVYFHLGEADFLISGYQRGTAFHLFLDDRRGVTIMLEPRIQVTLPSTIEEWRSHLE